MNRNPNYQIGNEFQEANKSTISCATQPITQDILNVIGYSEWNENAELMLSSNAFKSTKDCGSGTCS